MSQQAGRVLAALSLLQSRPRWNGRDLADKLEIEPRVLRRLLTALKDLGYPITSISGPGGGYELGHGAILPPLLLTDDEIVAVVAGLQSAGARTIEGMSQGPAGALAKIERMLPARSQKTVSNLRTYSVSFQDPGPELASEMLTIIASACRSGRVLQFMYQTHKGQSSTRTTEPHRLVNGGLLWYLLAFDQNRNDWRHFRLDRMSEIITLPQMGRRRAPPYEDIAKHTNWSVSNAGYTFQAKIIVDAPISDVVARLPTAAGVLEQVTADTTLLSTGADSLTVIAMYLLELGLPFHVLEPPELREALKNAATALLAAAETSPGHAL